MSSTPTVADPRTTNQDHERLRCSPAPPEALTIVKTVVVARIGRPQGVLGEVTIELHTDAPEERFADGSVLTTDPPERGPLRIEAARQHGSAWVLSIEGIEDRPSAETLRNTLLLVAADERPPLDQVDEFYDDQLIGLRVEDTEGFELGQVRRISHVGGDLLVIRRNDGRELLVPFVSAIVPEVDLAAGKVVVDPPPGLLEL
ncbi:MAG: ribosome maturation factor RimM [Geodermatophilaceae bacterium]|nr:ribosome maturation factor RimM [Geodermatophilaceae bacterium]